MRRLTLAFAAAGALCGSAGGHEAHTGQDYSRYKQRNGASCCSGRDCRPVAYAMRPDGSVLMFPDGQRVIVERERVNPLFSDDGKAHWCGIVLPGGRTMTFCAILPSQLSAAPEIGLYASLVSLP